MTTGGWEDLDFDHRGKENESRGTLLANVSAPLLLVMAGLVIGYLVILTDWLAANL